MKKVKSLKEFNLLIKGVSETTENQSKERKGECVIMFFVTLGASLLGKLLTGKEVISANERTIKACQDF